ncbi:hypothetical protein ALC57_13301 [Trachymyrmex cornetzi]|uniref:Reverse transcriptase domain-containing protein n=1 Tax=Trachymyrmex cornetzi TaxID=471704 RepID=A0A151IZH3_9HYME|nr:hypothetical protein ALC57_13301 [Trachymyrmex cornetzi]
MWKSTKTFLNNNRNIILTRADKGNVTVAMDKSVTYGFTIVSYFIVLQDIEEEALRRLNIDIPFYYRYVDNIAMAVPYEMIDKVLKVINSFHDRIQFTLGPVSLEELKENIREEMRNISRNTCEAVIENFRSRLQQCQNSQGSHMDDVIFKK